MDVGTGKVYKSEEAALEDGVKKEDLVIVYGSVKQVKRLSKAVRRKKGKAAKKSRKKNR